MVSLLELVEKLEHTPVSLADLRKLIPENCKAVELKHLKGKHRSSIFKDNEGMIVRLPSDLSKIGHFVCLLPKQHHIEYFSSLGNSPVQETKRLGNDKTLLELLGTEYIYNRKPLQSGKFNIKTCGMWVVTRLFLRDLKLREFQTLFSRSLSLQTSDDIVSIMMLILFSEV